MTDTPLERSYLGPSPDLLDLFAKASAAPAMSQNRDYDALRDRVVGVREFDDLEHADQEFLTRCVREVEAGASAKWQHPDSWGADWAAEDAATELAEDGEVADDTVVPVPVAQVKAYDYEDEVDEDGTELDNDGPLLPPADDSGWVGL